MQDDVARGRDLEQRIRRYFEVNGYDAKTNQVLIGRSDARHEIDVIAEKSDGITTFKVAVECKAWNHPIEKDVVSKLSYVMSDLGLHKGIVVSLAGTRVGAEASAQTLGIELWGPAELEQRLGQVALADLRATSVQRLARVIPLTTSINQAQPLIARQAGGRLGFGREEVVWIRLVWMPEHLVQIISGQQQKGFLTRRALSTTPLWNLYESLTGRYVDGFYNPPQLIEENIGTTIPPLMQVTKIVQQIRKALQKYGEVVTDSARARYAIQLEDLGIPPGSVSVTVERSEVVHSPYFVGLLSRAGQQRLLAVSGNSGKFSPVASTAFTKQIGYILDALPANSAGAT